MLNPSEHYLLVLEDHKTIHETSLIFEKILEKRDIQLLINSFKAKKLEIAELMSSHFEMEENFLYPAIISGNNCKREVTEEVLNLIKEHGEIERLLKVIVILSETSAETVEILSETLFGFVYEIIMLIKKHEMDEMKLFEEVGI